MADVRVCLFRRSVSPVGVWMRPIKRNWVNGIEIFDDDDATAN
jgi:hypothetical protein